MFTEKASNLISVIGNGTYIIACVERCQLIDLLDETRNMDGQSPDMIIDSYLFLNEAEISVRIWFDHTSAIEHPRITLKFIDLIKHMHFNGEAILHNQNKKQVNKSATKQSITRGHIIDWMNDILSGRIAYKTTEIVLI